MVGRWHKDRRPAGDPEVLPEGLGARLRDIARQEMLCRDVDRLWAEHLRGELDAHASGRIVEHAAACSRCTAVLAALSTAVVLEVEPLPARLRFRLAGLRRALRPPLPFYLRDLRFAAAASWFLAFALAALAGGPEALAQRGRDVLGGPVSGAAVELEERGDRWTDRLAQQARQVGASLGEGWQRLGAEVGSGLRSLEGPFRNQAPPAADEGRRGSVPDPETVHSNGGDSR